MGSVGELEDLRSRQPVSTSQPMKKTGGGNDAGIIDPLASAPQPLTMHGDEGRDRHPKCAGNEGGLADDRPRVDDVVAGPDPARPDP
jgi:hypothetical protein